jgi:hypothetical protein
MMLTSCVFRHFVKKYKQKTDEIDDVQLREASNPVTAIES